MSFERKFFVPAAASLGICGLLQVLNLTDQPTRTCFGNTTETSTIQYFGRTCYAGFSLNL